MRNNDDRRSTGTGRTGRHVHPVIGGYRVVADDDRRAVQVHTGRIGVPRRVSVHEPGCRTTGGYAICASLKAGISRPQMIESVQGMAGISLESAKKIVFAATTYLCPR
ncbi:DUF732 domain-containing protein [Pseudonocardia cypriaca]|uniref:DUF732 domain-containing protein n=1 Tax=Pseudonocardia cypriaca TaxID=882449 RepID=UPI001150F077|nr:DUF732 domain-containing protein [Pseudonocardia cypriaca]